MFYCHDCTPRHFKSSHYTVLFVKRRHSDNGEKELNSPLLPLVKVTCSLMNRTPIVFLRGHHLLLVWTNPKESLSSVFRKNRRDKGVAVKGGGKEYLLSSLGASLTCQEEFLPGKSLTNNNNK